ncbi:unknown [Prevotella sp. CAG:1320]|nr:unknown [Prevotella sp. CAG:1320]
MLVMVVIVLTMFLMEIMILGGPQLEKVMYI